jgi:hypothetical protein
LFYLDKDLDDLFHTKVFSDHVVYTRYYHVENYLFVQGDILRGAAAGASLDQESIAPTLGNLEDWRARKAALWRDWVVLCLFAEVFGVQSRCLYKRTDSAVNNPPSAPTNAAAHEMCKQELRSKYAGTQGDFARHFSRIERMVERYYRMGRYDLIFKGKWYVRHLQSDVENAMEGQNFSSHALSNAIVAALRATVDFEGEWAEHLKQPLQSVAARVADPSRGMA